MRTLIYRRSANVFSRMMQANNIGMMPRYKVEIQSDGLADEDHAHAVTPRKARLGSESTREEVSA